MKKLLIVTILLIGGLFISCSSNESEVNTSKTPVILPPSAITISSISSEFVFTGELLEIVGTNFINKDYPTKIFINDVEVSPKELSNNKIQISITDALKAGANTLRLEIDKVISFPVSFFIMAKGWNKITAYGDYNIQTSCVFDESKTIFSFIDTELASNSFCGTPYKLEGKSSGYKVTYLNSSGCNSDFKMSNDNFGVLINSVGFRYTNDCLATSNFTPVDQTFTIGLEGLKVAYIDSKSCLLRTVTGGQIYTEDNGKTLINNEPPDWAYFYRSPSGSSSRLYVSILGKSISNQKFYQLGVLYTRNKTTGNYDRKNTVMESATGYSNWTILDSISVKTNYSNGDYKFLNINKIYTINSSDKTLHESNDMLKTWKVIKTDVTSIFLRTETQWYIQSGDKLYVTTDAGQTWNLELELPAGSIVNDISFSNSKIIVSGNKGLLYVKIE